MASALHHKVEGKEMMNYSVIELPITDFKQVAKKILFDLKNIQQLVEEEEKMVQEGIDKEKRVSPVLEIKVYFSDDDQLHQHVAMAVAVDDEEEKETKIEQDYSVLDVSTAKNLEQVMAMLEEKKEKNTKTIIKVSASPSPLVVDVEEDEKDKVEEEDEVEEEELEEEEEEEEKDKMGEEEEEEGNDVEEEEERCNIEEEEEEKKKITKKVLEFELDDGWDYYIVGGDPDEFSQFSQYETKERRDLLLYYYKIYCASDGFYVVSPPPPGYCWASPIDLNDSSQLEVVNRMAKFAVENYNKKYKKKGKRIEFVRVHHANITRAYRNVYYITLLAKDLIKDDDEEKTYQTKVVHWEFLSGGESINVCIFRPKSHPSSQAI